MNMEIQSHRREPTNCHNFKISSNQVMTKRSLNSESDLETKLMNASTNSLNPYGRLIIRSTINSDKSTKSNMRLKYSSISV